MPRRSGRIATNSSPATAASGTKRSLESSSPSRTRQKDRKLNPTRSKYFGGKAQDGPSGELPSDLSEEEASDDSSDYNVDEDRTVGGRSRTRAKRPARASVRKNKAPPNTNTESTQSGKKGAATHPTATGGKELWREGVRTGLGPGKEVFIPLPKAREPGNVPYEDHTIHPNTMLFLKDLKEHNEREWFKSELSKLTSSFYRFPLRAMPNFLTQLIIDQSMTPTIVHRKKTGTLL